MEPVARKACGRGTVNEAYLDKFREERTKGGHCDYLFSSPSVSSPSASEDTPYKTGDDIADITSPDINSKEDGKEDWRKSTNAVQIDNRGYGQHRNLLTSMAMSGTENDKNLLQILENVVTDKKLSSTESYTESNVDGEPTDQFRSCESDEHDAMGMGGAVIAGTDSVMCEEDGVGQGESDERGVDGEPTDQFGSYEGDECDEGEDVSDEFASYESDEHDAGTDSVMCREDGAGQGETEDRDAMGMGGDVIAGTDSVMCREDGVGQGETEDRDAMGMGGDVIAGTDSMQSDEHAVIDSVGQGETEDHDAMGSNAVPVHQSEEQEVHGMKEGVINITPHDAVELQDVVNLTGQYLYNANTGEVHNIDHIDISQFKEIYFLDTEQQVTVPQIERQESVPEIEQQETNYSLSVVVESDDDIKEEKEDNTENQKREFGEIVKSDEVEDKSMNDGKEKSKGDENEHDVTEKQNQTSDESGCDDKEKNQSDKNKHDVTENIEQDKEKHNRTSHESGCDVRQDIEGSESVCEVTDHNEQKERKRNRKRQPKEIPKYVFSTDSRSDTTDSQCEKSDTTDEQTEIDKSDTSEHESSSEVARLTSSGADKSDSCVSQDSVRLSPDDCKVNVTRNLEKLTIVDKPPRLRSETRGQYMCRLALQFTRNQHKKVTQVPSCSDSDESILYTLFISGYCLRC